MAGAQKTDLIAREHTLPGRAMPLATDQEQIVLGTPLKGPFPEGFEVAVFGMGCFWGVERKFWNQPHVWGTAVGYAGGVTPNPTYEEVCTGLTNHAEVVQVVFNPQKTSYAALLKVFWENHDPTQGMRQGGDVGTPYRSVLLTTSDAQVQTARASLAAYQDALSAAGKGQITTEIKPLEAFYYAEGYHQGYLAKNPGGYCGLGGTGVTCPVGVGVSV